MSTPSMTLAEALSRPVRAFLATERAGTILLLSAAAAALLWANSPVGGSYETVWQTPLTVRLGEFALDLDLRHWINDGLMALFFFVIGMEVSREFTLGEMRDRAMAAVPVMAALGGLTVPAAVYLAFNAGGPGQAGWGIPTATDTAFVLGVLALVGPRCPDPLRVFLLTLAVVDDVGATLVIALAYTPDLELTPLLLAFGLFGLVLVLRRLGVWRAAPYAVIAVAMWVATVSSGLHPIVVGIALGVVVQVYAPGEVQLLRVRELVHEFTREPTPERGRAATLGVRAAVPPNERLQLLLHPWTSYVVVPLFALANAGVPLGAEVLSRAATSPVTHGVAAGLVAGNLAGVSLGSWLGLRWRRSMLPGNLVWGQLAGGAALAGIGFTVSLFITDIAFPDAAIRTEAKIGILAGSLVAAALGWTIFRLAWNRGAVCAPPSAPGETAPEQEPPALADAVSDGDHVQGRSDAPVTLVEYGDYACPYCGQAYPVVEALRERYGDRLRLAFRHYPLTEVHPDAWGAALAAEAAGVHGRFWEMHHELFTHQRELDEPGLAAHAERIGLPGDAVTGPAAEA
ncbi:MAG: Na+/H+ antiporter NhaA, partial [Carbonactinosporaceae bacterium]